MNTIKRTEKDLEREIAKELKNLPIDRAITIQTKKHIRQIVGRRRPDLDEHENLFFEQSKGSFLLVKKPEIVFIHGYLESDIITIKKIKKLVDEQTKTNGLTKLKDFS